MGRRSAKSTLLLCVVAIIGVIALVGANLMMRITLNRNCTGFLERAANANTVETAKEELGKAIKYLEDNKITSGYTSIIYETPSEDVGFWYKNLKDSYEELDKVDANSSSVEKTNLLMKLRETIMETGEKGDHLTVPNGLARFPNNGLWALGNALAIIVIFILYVEIKRYE